MKISVLVCTRDRHETIGQAVESIAQCEYPDFDIHIMDQSTDDQTAQIVRSLAGRYKDRCVIHYHHLDKAGLSRAYNAGIQASEGEVIAMTDDDCIVPPDWLARISAAFSGDDRAGILFGQVMTPQSLRGEVTRGVVVPEIPIPQRERFCRGGRFRVFGMGANMAIRRTLFEKIGGFDEALGGGGPLRSSQDFDYMYRAFRAGSAVLLEPDVKADHYGTRTAEQWPDTLRNYGIGDGAFYAKHVRCGDLYALWLLSKKLLLSRAREIRNGLRLRKWTPDIYGRNILTGIRAASRYAVDKKRRLYRETEQAKMTVTDANRVTAQQSSAGQVD